jgi:hypothetical protein
LSSRNHTEGLYSILSPITHAPFPQGKGDKIEK